jgi:plastocyanin
VNPRWIALSIVAGLVSGASISALAASVQITMDNLVIAPAEASAKVGDTIEWVNNDPFAHTATARSGGWDVMLPPKKSGSLVLQQAGTFEYYCRFHPNMKATLTVAP